MLTLKLVIYDGDCLYCRSFVRLLGWLDRQRRFRVLPYQSAESQALLRAQFGDHCGFSLFLFEENSVSWGREAARRIVKTLHLPGAPLAFWLYPTVVRVVSFLTRREQIVCGPECAGRHAAASVQSLPLKDQLKQMREGQA